MNTSNALVIGSLIVLMALASPSLAQFDPETSNAAAAAPIYRINRPSDAAASCNALVAEIGQVSTEVELRSIAQANLAMPTLAGRRLSRLRALLKQRGCEPGPATPTTQV